MYAHKESAKVFSKHVRDDNLIDYSKKKAYSHLYDFYSD